MAKLDANDKRKLLHTMLLSRAGDLREQSLIRQGKGWFHVSGMGHEALSVAGYLLQDGDFVSGHYRDRPIVLARGMDSYELALTFYAKRNSSSGGRQMPAHFSNRELGILSVNSVVGTSMLPAAGIAWGIQLDKNPNVVLATIGDAGSRQGEFFEAIAFALERQLPVVFLVEDNGIGISTVTEKMIRFSIPFNQLLKPLAQARDRSLSGAGRSEFPVTQVRMITGNTGHKRSWLAWRKRIPLTASGTISLKWES
jgi:2-oxoisovalerate dehydrogenase E1 component